MGATRSAQSTDHAPRGQLPCLDLSYFIMNDLQRWQLEVLEQRCFQVIRDIHYIMEHMNYPQFAGFELQFSLADHLGLMERLLHDLRRALAAYRVGAEELKALLAFKTIVDDSLGVYHTIIGNLHRSTAR